MRCTRSCTRASKRHRFGTLKYKTLSVSHFCRMPFGSLTLIGPRNHVLDGGADPHGKRLLGKK